MWTSGAGRLCGRNVRALLLGAGAASGPHQRLTPASDRTPRIPRCRPLDGIIPLWKLGNLVCPEDHRAVHAWDIQLTAEDDRRSSHSSQHVAENPPGP